MTYTKRVFQLKTLLPFFLPLMLRHRCLLSLPLLFLQEVVRNCLFSLQKNHVLHFDLVFPFVVMTNVSLNAMLLHLPLVHCHQLKPCSIAQLPLSSHSRNDFEGIS